MFVCILNFQCVKTWRKTRKRCNNLQTIFVYSQNIAHQQFADCRRIVAHLCANLWVSLIDPSHYDDSNLGYLQMLVRSMVAGILEILQWSLICILLQFILPQILWMMWQYFVTVFSFLNFSSYCMQNSSIGTWIGCPLLHALYCILHPLVKDYPTLSLQIIL